MGRIQGLTESPLYTASQLLKTGRGFVFKARINFIGVAAGSRIYLRDGTDAAAPVKALFIVPGTNGTTVNGDIPDEWVQGLEFESGIFYDAGAADVTDQIFAQFTFK